MNERKKEKRVMITVSGAKLICFDTIILIYEKTTKNNQEIEHKRN